MDVAVFVGLAARGPVHRPVAVDSMARYQSIFGGDLALAFDLDRGEPVHAHLGSTVRGFFANGGRRCWIIRVTRTADLEQAWAEAAGRDSDLTEIATTNRFPVPGVLALAAAGVGSDASGPYPAMASARSPGAWSDGLLLSSALLATGLRLLDCAALDPPAGLRIRLRSSIPLHPGDLIELDTDTSGTSTALRLFARIDGSDTADRSVPELQATLCCAFEPLVPGSEPEPVDAEIAALASNSIPADLLPVEQSDGMHPLARLRFTDTVPASLTIGHWVRWSAQGKGCWLRIDRRLEQTDGLLVEGPAWRQQPAILPDPAPTHAARLTLDLRVGDETGAVHRLTEVGLTPEHTAAWWQWLDDESQYDRMAEQHGDGGSSDLVRADTFPLAATIDETTTPPSWIPLGVEASFGPSLGPLPQAGDRLTRDGLARFDSELFLDPTLAEVKIGQLLAQIDQLRFIAPVRRRPYGIHAALAIGTATLFNEASLIAVPDAVHPGWIRRATEDLPTAKVAQTPPDHWLAHRGPCVLHAADQSAQAPDFSRFLDCTTRRLEPPMLQSLAGPVPRGTFTLRWSSNENDATFLLEESRTGGFDDARGVYRGPGTEAQLPASREGIYYYRVSAFAEAECSAPSDPITVLVRDTDWVMRTLDDETLPAASDPASDEILRIHHALLRLAAANAGLFAVLSLPRCFRAREAIAYAARLNTTLVSPASGDGLQGRRALSFGAIYHPWLQLARPVPPSIDNTPETLRPTTAPVYRACPPDGAAIGILSTRARQRGVWIAPANERLTGLVALTPNIDPADRLALQQARINLIQAEARGFLVLGANTLSDDEDWRAINVRRLFSLLRRLAIRRGLSYVFEPNGDLLRRAVERGFSGLLTDLFRRGAFAGNRAEQSFQVITSGAINTPSDRDQGRFIVELRVAPALPLRFLGLRLLQRGEQLTLVEDT